MARNSSRRARPARPRPARPPRRPRRFLAAGRSRASRRRPPGCRGQAAPRPHYVWRGSELPQHAERRGDPEPGVELALDADGAVRPGLEEEFVDAAGVVAVGQVDDLEVQPQPAAGEREGAAGLGVEAGVVRVAVRVPGPREPGDRGRPVRQGRELRRGPASSASRCAPCRSGRTTSARTGGSRRATSRRGSGPSSAARERRRSRPPPTTRRSSPSRGRGRPGRIPRRSISTPRRRARCGLTSTRSASVSGNSSTGLNRFSQRGWSRESRR